MKRFILSLFSCCLLSAASAQMTKVAFDDKAWDLTNAETQIEPYMGKQSLRLANGEIFLPDVLFFNGTIEVDINFPGRRAFPGVAFRRQDAGNMEHFYIRPHQSGNPDACQYTPVFNGFAGWQLYHGEGYGTPLKLTPDQWHHLKIVVRGSSADIFFDDMENPAVKVNRLKGDFQAGSIGLNAGPAVHVANFAYSPDNGKYPNEVEAPVADPAVVSSWQLSQILDNDRFEGKTMLDNAELSDLSWKTYPTESTGLMNFSRYSVPAEGKTTVVAKLIVPSDGDEVKGLTFGYSDEVMVYVNGKLQYRGQNNFLSRDYRYLGTIGYFDAVYLDLKKGDNEVWFVVKENFGGWGIQAKWL